MWKVLALFLLSSFSLLITYYTEISFHQYIAFCRLLDWKKHASSSLKRKSDGYKTVGTSWFWNLFHLLLSSSEFFFQNRLLLWVSISYPKPILKELFYLQLWSCTFFQNVTILFHLYTSFKFLESFAWKNHLHIVWKDYSVLIFSKAVSCIWRCGCHRLKAKITK